MRDNILAVAVIIVCIAGLVRPRLGLYGYIWYALMRPDMLAWSTSMRPYSFMIAVTLLTSSLRYVSRVWHLFINPISRWLILLQVPIIGSIIFAVDPSICWDPFNIYFRIIVMSLLIPVLIETPAQLRTLTLVMAASIGVLGSKYGIYGVVHGGARFSEGYGGMLSDNNCLALALVIGVALCWYSRDLVSRHWLRLLFIGMAAASAAGAIMTYSRGAAISLGSILIIFIYHSKRRVLTALGTLMVAIPPLILVGTSYMDRLATIKAPSEESSAQSRLDNYSAALRMWTDYPLLGVGFGEENERQLFSRYTQRAVEGKDLVVHDTYLQILVDCGAIACLIYTGLLLGVIIWLGSARQRERAEELQTLPSLRALQAALIAFLIGAVFLSRESFDFTYILLMTAAAWWQMQRNSDLAMVDETEADTPIPAVV